MVETEITTSLAVFDEVANNDNRPFYGISSFEDFFAAARVEIVTDTYDVERDVRTPTVTFRCWFNTDAEAVAAKLRWDGE